MEQVCVLRQVVMVVSVYFGFSGVFLLLGIRVCGCQISVWLFSVLMFSLVICCCSLVLRILVIDDNVFGFLFVDSVDLMCFFVKDSVSILFLQVVVLCVYIGLLFRLLLFVVVCCVVICFSCCSCMFSVGVQFCLLCLKVSRYLVMVQLLFFLFIWLCLDICMLLKNIWYCFGILLRLIIGFMVISGVFIFSSRKVMFVWGLLLWWVCISKNIWLVWWVQVVQILVLLIIQLLLLFFVKVFSDVRLELVLGLEQFWYQIFLLERMCGK